MNLKIALTTLAIASSLLAPSAWATPATEAALLAQGDKEWAQGKQDDAKKRFELAVATNPASVPARMKLAGLLLAEHNFAAAIQNYQQTISLDSQNAKAWMGLGMAYLHTGQKELSRAAFSEAIRADPSRKPQLAKLAESSAQ